MSLNSIEEDEQIIHNLEELDSTFSSIRNNLREMKSKVLKISYSSRELATYLAPWTRFFEDTTKNQVSPLSDLHLNSLHFTGQLNNNFKENMSIITNSPNIMNVCSPRNPFKETNSSDLLTKSILKDFKSSGILATDSSNTIILNKSQFGNYDTVVNCDSDENEHNLSTFSFSKVPDVFSQEEQLKTLYDFINTKKSVTVADICKEFEETSPEKLEIFIDLLLRKRFVRIVNNCLTTEKDTILKE